MEAHASPRASPSRSAAQFDSIPFSPMDNIRYYDSPVQCHLIGCDSTRRSYHVLTFRKQSPSPAGASGSNASAERADAATTDSTSNLERLEYQAAVYSPVEAQGLHTALSAQPDVQVGRLYGILGCIRFTEGYYIIGVASRRLVARLGIHRVFEVGDVQLISLTVDSDRLRKAYAGAASASTPASASSSPLAGVTTFFASVVQSSSAALFTRNKAEAGYREQFLSQHVQQPFYYSHTYDLTNTVQTNMTTACTVTAGAVSAAGLDSDIFAKTRARTATHRHRRSKYIWNEFFLEPFTAAAGTEDSDGSESRWGTSGRSATVDESTASQASSTPLSEDLCSSASSQLSSDSGRGSTPSATAAAADATEPQGSSYSSDQFTAVWAVYMIRGAVVQKMVWAMPSRRPLLLTIIARTSKQAAGARYLRRGVDSDGHVANHVELEQVLLDESTLNHHFTRCAVSSYVQVRGSVPVRWLHPQSSTLPKPAIVLDGSDSFHTATCRHFQELLRDYGAPVVVMNYLKMQDGHRREEALGRAYCAAVDVLRRYVNDGGPGAREPYRGGRAADSILRYRALDLRRAGGRSWNTVTALAELDERDVGLFACARDGTVDRLQTGVVRSNCVDCIDRTNIGQFFFGQHALGAQLASLGFLGSPADLPFSHDLHEELLTMYLSVGDALATQYGGSAQVGAGVLNRGAGWDQMMGMKRLYSNALGDRNKQSAMNLYLGRFQPDPRGRLSSAYRPWPGANTATEKRDSSIGSLSSTPLLAALQGSSQGSRSPSEERPSADSRASFLNSEERVQGDSDDGEDESVALQRSGTAPLPRTVVTHRLQGRMGGHVGLARVAVPKSPVTTVSSRGSSAASAPLQLRHRSATGGAEAELDYYLLVKEGPSLPCPAMLRDWWREPLQVHAAASPTARTHARALSEMLRGDHTVDAASQAELQREQADLCRTVAHVALRERALCLRPPSEDCGRVAVPAPAGRTARAAAPTALGEDGFFSSAVYSAAVVATAASTDGSSARVAAAGAAAGVPTRDGRLPSQPSSAGNLTEATALPFGTAATYPTFVSSWDGAVALTETPRAVRSAGLGVASAAQPALSVRGAAARSGGVSPLACLAARTVEMDGSWTRPIAQRELLHNHKTFPSVVDCSVFGAAERSLQSLPDSDMDALSACSDTGNDAVKATLRCALVGQFGSPDSWDGETLVRALRWLDPAVSPRTARSVCSVHFQGSCLQHGQSCARALTGTEASSMRRLLDLAFGTAEKAASALTARVPSRAGARACAAELSANASREQNAAEVLRSLSLTCSFLSAFSLAPVTTDNVVKFVWDLQHALVDHVSGVQCRDFVRFTGHSFAGKNPWAAPRAYGRVSAAAAGASSDRTSPAGSPQGKSALVPAGVPVKECFSAVELVRWLLRHSASCGLSLHLSESAADAWSAAWALVWWLLVSGIVMPAIPHCDQQAHPPRELLCDSTVLFRLHGHTTIANRVALNTNEDAPAGPAAQSAAATPVLLAESLASVALSIVNAAQRVPVSDAGTFAELGHSLLTSLRETAEALHYVDVASVPASELLCFWINIYNTCYAHAWLHLCVRGAPETADAHGRTSEDATETLSAYGYLVGPHFLSLYDIKYGLLCANRPSPCNFLPPFPAADCRERWTAFIPPELLAETVPVGDELLVIADQLHHANVGDTGTSAQTTRRRVELAWSVWQEDRASFLQQRVLLALLDVYLTLPASSPTRSSTADGASNAVSPHSPRVFADYATTMRDSCSVLLLSPKPSGLSDESGGGNLPPSRDTLGMLGLTLRDSSSEDGVALLTQARSRFSLDPRTASASSSFAAPPVSPPSASPTSAVHTPSLNSSLSSAPGGMHRWSLLPPARTTALPDLWASLDATDFVRFAMHYGQVQAGPDAWAATAPLFKPPRRPPQRNYLRLNIQAGTDAGGLPGMAPTVVLHLCAPLLPRTWEDQLLAVERSYLHTVLSMQKPAHANVLLELLLSTFPAGFAASAVHAKQRLQRSQQSSQRAVRAREVLDELRTASFSSWEEWQQKLSGFSQSLQQASPPPQPFKRVPAESP